MTTIMMKWWVQVVKNNIFNSPPDCPTSDPQLEQDQTQTADLQPSLQEDQYRILNNTATPPLSPHQSCCWIWKYEMYCSLMILSSTPAKSNLFWGQTLCDNFNICCDHLLASKLWLFSHFLKGFLREICVALCLIFSYLVLTPVLHLIPRSTLHFPVTWSGLATWMKGGSSTSCCSR